jgi:hypothetical protein
MSHKAILKQGMPMRQSGFTVTVDDNGFEHFMLDGLTLGRELCDPDDWLYYEFPDLSQTLPSVLEGMVEAYEFTEYRKIGDSIQLGMRYHGEAVCCVSKPIGLPPKVFIRSTNLNDLLELKCQVDTGEAECKPLEPTLASRQISPLMATVDMTPRQVACA